MKVIVQMFRGSRTVDLAIALTPVCEGDLGAVERAQASAGRAADAMGALLAKLVEKKLLSLDEACDIAGQYATVTPVTDDDIPF